MTFAYLVVNQSAISAQSARERRKLYRRCSLPPKCCLFTSLWEKNKACLFVLINMNDHRFSNGFIRKNACLQKPGQKWIYEIVIENEQVFFPQISQIPLIFKYPTKSVFEITLMNPRHPRYLREPFVFQHLLIDKFPLWSEDCLVKGSTFNTGIDIPHYEPIRKQFEKNEVDSNCYSVCHAFWLSGKETNHP